MREGEAGISGASHIRDFLSVGRIFITCSSFLMRTHEQYMTK